MSDGSGNYIVSVGINTLNTGVSQKLRNKLSIIPSMLRIFYFVHHNLIKLNTKSEYVRNTDQNLTLSCRISGMAVLT